MKKYLLIVSIFALASCKSITDKNIELLEKQNDLIISKTESVKEKIVETKKVVSASNCEREQDIQEQLNDVEINIMEIQGDNKVLGNAINSLKQGYSNEIKVLNSKIFYRDITIAFLCIYLLKRWGILDKIINFVFNVIKKLI